MRNNLVNELAHQLELLAESADKYVADGSWIESMTDDIRNAKSLLKRYYKAKRALEMMGNIPASETIL